MCSKSKNALDASASLQPLRPSVRRSGGVVRPTPNTTTQFTFLAFRSEDYDDLL
jgi:hypothetical protein